MYTLPSRLLPAAKIVFGALENSGAKGIIFGGAAAAMNGSMRQTKDVDINVTAFPDFKDSHVFARPTSDNMMKVTYIPLDGNDAVKCDVATRRADLMPLFLKYSIQDEENGITAAGLALLLADKIRTIASRGNTQESESKRNSDMEDITFCITKMYKNKETMPNELKILYSKDDWNKVLGEFATEEYGPYWKGLAERLRIG